MTAEAEDWSQGEIVRTLQRMVVALERLETKVDLLDGKFVPREIHDRDYGHMTGRVDEHGLRLVDIEADMARLRKEQADKTAQSWRFWVGLAIAGLLLPVVVAVITASIIGG